MGKFLFITGTDTGVGKTITAAAIISALKKEGISVCPLKPVETGCPKKDKTLVPEDSLFLSSLCDDLQIDELNIYRFQDPLAPAVAAEINRKEININYIITTLRKAADKFDIVVIEGAGGIMVPLTWKATFLDLVSQMKIPVIVVSANKLGTINHTLLTIHALKMRGLDIIGIILNTVNNLRDPSRKTNAYVIRKLTKVPIIGEIPYIKQIGKKKASFFYDLSLKYLNVDLVIKSLGLK